MNRPRLTIARWMGLTAIVATSLALVRAFLVHEMFCGGILIFMALLVGLWNLPGSSGRRRRFWLGFEASGVAAVLLLFSCEYFPDAALNRLVLRYTMGAGSLAYAILPEPYEDRLDQSWEIFLAVVYFVPEFLVAMLGGLAYASPVIARAGSREATSAAVG
ncbi:hypothetical protein TA3x_002936 [Tundrisphaera sp. TA3]|uniref:hypothetical protein n=1 Tax=Tundrisphaera sp. TA3 TaxID=3435775 RepID=UPI003EB90ABC